ncbi:MAG: hypothetical protein IKF82_05340 [Bacilli bacterium]|nr:hypothetical protein [Bacilli bacterium]
MNDKDYKYIENRLNEMCKHHITILYDKRNLKCYTVNGNINFDKIVLKIYGYGSHILLISKKYISYNFIVDLLYKKYLEVINK